MQQKEKSEKKDFSLKSRVGALILVILVIIVAVILLRPPERSVAAYCSLYPEEKTRLARLPGDTYSSGVFNDSLSDASEFATAFERLERLAPDDIKADVNTLRGIYKKMHDDPSQAIAASLSGASAEESVKTWTSEHCK